MKLLCVLLRRDRETITFYDFWCQTLPTPDEVQCHGLTLVRAASICETIDMGVGWDYGNSWKCSNLRKTRWLMSDKTRTSEDMSTLSHIMINFAKIAAHNNCCIKCFSLFPKYTMLPLYIVMQRRFMIFLKFSPTFFGTPPYCSRAPVGAKNKILKV